MIYFFDTSALIKRYVEEKGSAETINLFNKAEKIYTSFVTKIECMATFKRLLDNEEINHNDYKTLVNYLHHDFNYFDRIEFSEAVERICEEILEEYYLKSLDIIQLACALYAREEIDNFVVSDKKLKKYAVSAGLQVIDPTAINTK